MLFNIRIIPLTDLILSDIFLPIVESFNALSLSDPGLELASIDVPVAGPEDPAAVFLSCPELSRVVVAVVVDGSPPPTLDSILPLPHIEAGLTE